MGERGYYNRAARRSGGARKFIVAVQTKCFRCQWPVIGPPAPRCSAPEIHTEKKRDLLEEEAFARARLYEEEKPR